MNYNEFKNTYKWIINQAPDITSLYGRDGVTIEMITTNYKKVGTKWTETGTTSENITVTFYFNVFDAVPFFRNLGGYERIIKAYTRHGLIPVENISISPDKKEKVVRKFKF